MSRTTASWLLTFLLAVACTGCSAIEARAGVGTFEYALSDGGAKDEADATLFDVVLRGTGDDGVVRPGVQLELWRTDELFANRGGFEVDAVEVTPFIEWRNEQSEIFRIPVRLGLMYHSLDLDAIEARWQTFGMKLGIAPEVDLIRGDKGALSVQLDVSYALGGTTIESGSIETDEFEGESSILGAGAFLAYERGSVELGGGVVLRQFESEDVEDSTGSVNFFGVDHELSAVVVYLRARL